MNKSANYRRGYSDGLFQRRRRPGRNAPLGSAALTDYVNGFLAGRVVGKNERSVVVSALADAFAVMLREWLTVEEFAEMKALNETPEYANGLCCASHNYCDANMAMDAAWRVMFGAGSTIDADDEEQARLWNDAWSLARERHLGSGKVVVS